MMLTYRVEVKRAHARDAEALLERGLRAADERELWRVSGITPADALQRSMELSHVEAGIFVNDVIVALLGVGSMEGDCEKTGLPWLMGHDDFERKETAVSMLRISKRFVECWATEFRRLCNLADPEHAKSMRYLEWLGFVIEWDKPLFGPFGDRLVYFWR